MSEITPLPQPTISWTEDLQRANNMLVDTVGSVANDVSAQLKCDSVCGIIESYNLSRREKTQLVALAARRYTDISDLILEKYPTQPVVGELSQDGHLLDT